MGFTYLSVSLLLVCCWQSIPSHSPISRASGVMDSYTRIINSWRWELKTWPPKYCGLLNSECEKYQVLRDLTSSSHQLLNLGPPWDPALCGFSCQARQGEQKLPMKPLPLELLLFPSIPSCPVSPVLVTSSCTQDLSLGMSPELLQSLSQGLLGITASDLGWGEESIKQLKCYTYQKFASYSVWLLSYF